MIKRLKLLWKWLLFTFWLPSFVEYTVVPFSWISKSELEKIRLRIEDVKLIVKRLRWHDKYTVVLKSGIPVKDLKGKTITHSRLTYDPERDRLIFILYPEAFICSHTTLDSLERTLKQKEKEWIGLADQYQWKV